MGGGSKTFKTDRLLLHERNNYRPTVVLHSEIGPTGGGGSAMLLSLTTPSLAKKGQVIAPLLKRNIMQFSFAIV